MRSRRDRLVSSSGSSMFSNAFSHRHQVVELEDEADMRGAPRREVRIAEMRDVDAVDDDAAAGGLVDARDEVQQRALAGAGRPHQRHEVAARDVEVEAEQDRHRLLAADVDLLQVADGDQRQRGAGVRHLAVSATAVPSTILSPGFTISFSPDLRFPDVISTASG